MSSTTLLGVEYPGKPIFGTLALYLCTLEAREGTEAAQRSLDAHNAIETAFGGKPIDLASQFTTASPMSMSTLMPKALALSEFDDGPKDCPKCGTEIEDGECGIGCDPRETLEPARHVLTNRVIRRVA